VATLNAVDQVGFEEVVTGQTLHDLPRPSITLIVPTRNEAANIMPLLERCRRTLAGVPSEVIFVDDSDDATEATIRDARVAIIDPMFDVWSLHRAPDERSGGLGGAVVAGLKLARGRWVCVLDGDLQHPPEVIRELMDEARDAESDLVIASRYCDGGDGSGLSSSLRGVGSKVAGRIATTMFSSALDGITDPMSGFFLFRRDAVDPEILEPEGYKVLLEIVVRTPSLRISEVGFHFAPRQEGDSKASVVEGTRFLRHAARLRTSGRRTPTARTMYHYDIHGIIRVESEGVLPELEWFCVRALDRPADITVRVGHLPRTPPRPGLSSSGPRHLRYQEIRGNRGFAADLTVTPDLVEVTATPIIAKSPHVLYTNLVEPILRWRFVERGYALTHGACVVDDGRAYLITARTDTGKTTTMLKLLDAHPLAFIADDLTILTPQGDVLPYPKPLTISQHTLHAVTRARLGRWEQIFLPLQSRVHSRSGRRFAFLLTRTGIPVATTNTLVQLVIPPPKYAVERLVPGVAIAPSGSLQGMFVIQRGGEGEETLEPDEALDILLRNCEDAYGFPPYHDLEAFLLGSTGHDLRAEERQIMASALSGHPSTLLRSTTLDWATRIPEKINGFQHVDTPSLIDLRVSDRAAERATAPVDVPLPVTTSRD
jgi:glycosyltransferase involved in cell wall biosynthesis